MRFQLTRVSDNEKTGPMPVSTSSADTCPDVCPLKGNIGCYANAGPLRFHWRKVTDGSRGMEWSQFLGAIQSLPRKQIWRHNQAGDLPGEGNNIDGKMLKELVAANKKASLHGFTYTHKPMTRANAAAVKHANDNGFVINLSANTLQEADALAKKNVGPVVVIVPEDAPEILKTPEGRRVIVCPAQTRDRVNCANCRMCCDSERTLIIGFRAHGCGKKTVAAIIKKLEAEERAK